MAKLYNLARMTVTSTGTGTITLGSAVAGFLSFASSGIADGDTVTYAIEDGANSEIGRGVYTSSGTTLTRSVLKSTSSNTPISVSTSAQVFITAAAEDLQTPDGISSINTGPLAGYRNRLINGGMQVWQRRTASVGDDAYGFDRWNNLAQTAATTLSQLTDVENTTLYMMRITQGQASAQRFGTEQIIESVNCRDLRGQVVTLSARVRCSNSTTLRYALIEWTGTADTVTSDFVNNWTSSTYTAGNFFTSTSTTVTTTGSTALTANTLTTVTLSGTVGSSMNNLVVMFWTDSTQAQNSTLDVGKVQIEIGSTATVFERRSFNDEIELCKRYYQKSFVYETEPIEANARQLNLIGAAYGTANITGLSIPITPEMRSAPTAVALKSSISATTAQWAWLKTDGSGWNTATSTSISSSDRKFLAFSLGVSAAVGGTAYIVAGDWTLDSEL